MKEAVPSGYASSADPPPAGSSSSASSASSTEKPTSSTENPNPALDNLFRVFLVFQEMRSRGVRPDLRAYNALVNTCAVRRLRWGCRGCVFFGAAMGGAKGRARRTSS